tara:strand:- start:70 stop:261 length:192 start_codon:yes stop_codon:yes gene_type:complete
MIKVKTIEESAKDYANYNDQINKAVQQAVLFGAQLQQEFSQKEIDILKEELAYEKRKYGRKNR